MAERDPDHEGTHGDDPGELVFNLPPLEEKLKFFEGDELIWEGTRREFTLLYDRIRTAKPATSGPNGKLYVILKPDTKYLVIEV